MNRSRRDKLRQALNLLKCAEASIENICDEEKDSLDNVPENLQSGDRFSMMEDVIDYLEDAIQNIQDAANSIDDALSCR